MKDSMPKIKNKIRSSLSFKKMNPHLHWKRLMYFFIVLVVLLVVFSIYLLFKIKNDQIFQIDSNSNMEPKLVDEKLLQKVTESFESKLIKEKEIKSGTKTYKDPS